MKWIRDVIKFLFGPSKTEPVEIEVKVEYKSGAPDLEEESYDYDLDIGHEFYNPDVEYGSYNPDKEVYEKSLISKWWKPEHDQIIIDYIDRHQWYWTFTNFYEEILRTIPEETLTWWKKNERLWDMNIDDNPVNKVNNMTIRYAAARAKYKGFTKRIRKPPYRKCLLCNQSFRIDTLKASLYERMGSIERIRFCDDCLTDHIFFAGNNRATKQQIRQYIRDLTQELQRIPPQNFGEGRADFLYMSDEERVRVFKLLKNKPTHDRVKKLYGSWFAAVVDSGVLEGNVRKTKRGIMCLAKDGHACLSLGEKTIDDLLYSLNIPHKKEVRYPEGNFRADFEVNGVFIEYFGLTGNPEYDEKTKLKQEICEKHGIKLISIYPKDVTNTQTLKEKLIKELQLPIKC